MKKTEFLTTPYGATLAYQRTPGRSPGVIFLAGFRSDMQGGKALRLQQHLEKRGNAFLRFDYRGHGQSSARFEDGCIGDWARDALSALDELTDGPQVIIGSSMGGWLMLLTALQRPERIAGLIGVAAAPDFTNTLISRHLTDSQQHTLEQTGQVAIPSCYDDSPFIITQKLLDDGQQHALLHATVSLDMPVRLLHGMQDSDIPWQTSMTLVNQISSADLELQLIKQGDHRLSEPQDLDRLCTTLDSLLHQLEQRVDVINQR